MGVCDKSKKTKSKKKQNTKKTNEMKIFLFFHPLLLK